MKTVGMKFPSLLRILGCLCGLFLAPLSGIASEKMHLWIAGADGVILASLDPQSGQISRIRQVSEHSLNWMASAGHRSLLFAGSTLADADTETDGAVASFHIGDDHSLEFVSHVPALGKTTIYVAPDPTARALFAVNFRYDSYTSRGSVVAFAVREAGGIGAKLQRFEHPGKGGSSSNRQLASHPHSIVVSPDGRHAAVADLGIDKVVVYHIQKDGKGLAKASEISARPGQQPRHLAWHPEGRFLYCMNEAAPTVSVARFDPETGQGEFIQHIERIQSKGGGGADIAIDSNGRYLFGSNRGEDTLAAFRNDREWVVSLREHSPSDIRKMIEDGAPRTSEEDLKPAHLRD